MLDTQREPARPSTRHKLSAPDRARTILTFAAAVTANVAIFAIARAVDVDFIVPDFGSDTATTEITAGHVVGASVAGLVVGWVALVLATKIGRPAPRVVAVVGGLIAVASTGQPLSLDTDFGVRGSLALMHLVVGAAYVYAIEMSTDRGQA